MIKITENDIELTRGDTETLEITIFDRIQNAVLRGGFLF